MMPTSVYPEINQAVPNLSYNPNHDMYEVPSPLQVPSPMMPNHPHVPSPQCQVPSPSQWLDPCRSPPSLHSPPHLPGDLDKMKEEPYSPPPHYTTLSSPPHLTPLTNAQMPPLTALPPIKQSQGDYMNHTIKKEGYESSINLAGILAENQSLISSMNQSQAYYRGEIIHPHSPSSMPQLSQQQRDKIDDELKKPNTLSNSNEFAFLDSLVEIKKEADVDYVRSSSREVLEAVGLLALDHAMRDLHVVSQNLRIPHDPYDWGIEDVKAWMKLQTYQLNIPPLDLVYWNMNGQELLKLNEGNFKDLAPQGGELLYAKLEIWKEALRTSPQASHYGQQPNPQVIASLLGQHNQQHLQQQQINQHHMNHSQQHSPQGHHMSPHHMLQPSPQTSPAHQPMMSPPCPTSQGKQHQPSLHTPVTSPSASVPSPLQQQSSPQQASPQQYMEESCLDMSTLLSGGSSSPNTSSPATPPIANVTIKQEPVESEDEVEEEVVSTTTGRGGTHIHLWQFLKEHLQQPQLYGSCIRWLDRPKGVFKIEDSVKVAKLWGKRKNRPAMNYDKLSRSIRQYYKKGIMKKTERSQRLVYKFCHPYSL